MPHGGISIRSGRKIFCVGTQKVFRPDAVLKVGYGKSFPSIFQPIPRYKGNVNLFYTIRIVYEWNLNGEYGGKNRLFHPRKVFFTKRFSTFALQMEYV